MDLIPSFEAFARLSRTARLVPVRAEFLFDTETAVTAYRKLARPPFGFLLESVVGGRSGPATPSSEQSQARRGGSTGTRSALWDPGQGWVATEVGDPLEDLDRRLRERSCAGVGGLPRFWGGAVGYFSYDLVRRIERLPSIAEEDADLPRGDGGLYRYRPRDRQPSGSRDGDPGGAGRAGADGAGAQGPLRRRCRGDRRTRRPACLGGGAPAALSRRRACRRSPLREHDDEGGLRGGRREDPRVHPRGRCFSGRAQPEAGHVAPGLALRPLQGVEIAQSVPVPLLHGARRRRPGRFLPRGAGPARGRDGHGETDRGNQAPRRRPRGGCRARGGAPRGREGAG